MKITSFSEQETINIASEYGSKLVGGEILALSGDLGAGKTAFSRGLARGLGLKKQVNSPTFVLMKVYKILKHPKIKHFVHIDAYRLESGQGLLDIGVEDWLGKSDSVVVIEWAEKVKDILPKSTKKIKFKHLKDSREINFI